MKRTPKNENTVKKLAKSQLVEVTPDEVANTVIADDTIAMVESNLVQNKIEEEPPITPTIIIASDTVGHKMSRIAKTMRKQFGDRSMMYLRENPDYTQVHNWVSTQNYAIDWILSGKADGTGGLPVGRIVELFGDPSSGKSLLLSQILAEVQRRGGIPVLYDPETTFDGYFASRVGLDVNSLMYSKCYKDSIRKKVVLGEDGHPTTAMIPVRLPATVEQLKDEIEELIDITYHEFPGVLLAIGLDSVAALSTKHELSDPDKKDFTKASGIRTFVKMLEAKMADQNCLFLATNHVIANIKIENKYEKRSVKKEGPQEDKTAPGGSGLPFGSSVRLDLLRGRDITENRILVVGHEIYVFSHKNKVWPAHKTSVVEMRFDSGMDRYSGLLEILLAKSVIEELGDQVFRFKGQRFKRKPMDRPKFIGLAEMIQQFPEMLTLSNEIF